MPNIMVNIRKTKHWFSLLEPCGIITIIENPRCYYVKRSQTHTPTEGWGGCSGNPEDKKSH